MTPPPFSIILPFTAKRSNSLRWGGVTRNPILIFLFSMYTHSCLSIYLYIHLISNLSHIHLSVYITITVTHVLEMAHGKVDGGPFANFELGPVATSYTSINMSDNLPSSPMNLQSHFHLCSLKSFNLNYSQILFPAFPSPFPIVFLPFSPRSQLFSRPPPPCPPCSPLFSCLFLLL